MWPFSVFRRHKYELRYRAARLMMLGKYTYSRLTPEEQRAVRDRTRQYLLTTVAAWVWKWQEKSPDRFYSDYVVAMKSMGIPPALAGEAWDIPDDIVFVAVPSSRIPLVNPMRLGSRNYRVGQFLSQLYFNYHYADPATEHARCDLVAHGADIPAVDPNALNEQVLVSLKNGGKFITRREWWLRHLPPDEK